MLAVAWRAFDLKETVQTSRGFGYSRRFVLCLKGLPMTPAHIHLLDDRTEDPERAPVSRLSDEPCAVRPLR